MGNSDGEQVGWMRRSEFDAVDPADPDAAVPVYDEDGERIGTYELGTHGGFKADRP